MKSKYLEALNNGREVVIISADENDDSAIFWKSNGKIYSFSVNMGTLERTDQTAERLQKHFERMEAENAQIFIRGYAD